jgi:hypothetical protein
MKKIKIPSPIAPVDMATMQNIEESPGRPLVRDFAAYAIQFWLSDPAAATNLDEQDRLINKILPSLRAACGLGQTEMWELEDADYNKLLPIVKNTKGFTNPLIAAQFLPFHRAFELAT